MKDYKEMNPAEKVKAGLTVEKLIKKIFENHSTDEVEALLKEQGNLYGEEWHKTAWREYANWCSLTKMSKIKAVGTLLELAKLGNEIAQAKGLNGKRMTDEERDEADEAIGVTNLVIKYNRFKEEMEKKDSPIITHDEDGNPIRLCECDELYQAYWDGEESMNALGCPLAVYWTEGMVIYPNGETEQP